ncbi:MAG: hypothetical protein WBD40_08045 [Tepidisphaeraceae bacterium]
MRSNQLPFLLLAAALTLFAAPAPAPPSTAATTSRPAPSHQRLIEAARSAYDLTIARHGQLIDVPAEEGEALHRWSRRWMRAELAAAAASRPADRIGSATAHTMRMEAWARSLQNHRRVDVSRRDIAAALYYVEDARLLCSSVEAGVSPRMEE